MEIYDFFDRQQLYITNQPGADVQVTDAVTLFLNKPDISANWQLNIMQGTIKVNYFSPQHTTFELVPGSILDLGNTVIKVFNDELHVLKNHVQTQLTQITKSSHTLPSGYPDYHRSPRLIYQAPHDKITVDDPPAPVKMTNQGLLRTIVPPLVMVAVSVVMMLMRANGFFMLASLATTLVSVIFAVSEYFKNKKQYKQDVKNRQQTYLAYFDTVVKQIHHAEVAQRHGAQYHYPDIHTLNTMATAFSARIYEKTPADADFLTYRLGLGTVAVTSPITGSHREQLTKDPLAQQAQQLVAANQTLSKMPIITDLTHNPLGYIGARQLVIEQLQMMLCQIAFFHSYHDVRFIAVFPEREYEQWAWLRWLPHFNTANGNLRGFVYNQKSRDQLLNELNHELKERQLALNAQTDKNQTLHFTPHYVLVVTDESLIIDHAIMELLNDEPQKLDVSLIYVKDVMTSLPANVKTVIDIRDRQTGELVMTQGQLINKRFSLDHLNGYEKANLPRLLAGLHHMQTLKSALPNQITFLQMYGVKTVAQLNIAQRWQKHSPYQTLAVPLGVSGPDELVELDLHERAHGPHGLIAGTTGSGKSELIQSYILSLAVNFHPYDVAFLLIDYKGGGMAHLFDKLPHLLGVITNLDKAQSMRALESIQAELDKRQRLFAENNVNHINQYQKLYKEGKVTEPMPHLFMISDEFAELKAEQPEFMEKLISTARIGRSLGIHLILATQKPAGVVDDQIWSNSNFKIALKVAEKEDSKEVLKTPDAAAITQPGRAYLQVGNNEIYELFQSAWSGADYRPDEDDNQQNAMIISEIDRMGQRHQITKDLSGLDYTGHMLKVPTQLEAVVAAINDTFAKSGAQPLPQPWLPPLRERIASDELVNINYHQAWQQVKQPLQAVIGMVDIPSEQAQRPIKVDLSADGNLAVYASAGYGKSTFLQTLIMNLAKTHTPTQMNVYLLDFGTNGLLPLRDLPQVADTIMLDETEKIIKFIKRMNAVLKERKRLLSEEAVANVAMYEAATGQVLPDIVIVIDNYEGFKDTKYEDALIQALIKITRDGNSVGMHVVISAGVTTSLRLPLANNIKQKIALKQNNDDDLPNIVGKDKLAIDDLPGRGLIKTLHGTRLFQTALPAAGIDGLTVTHNGPSNECRLAWRPSGSNSDDAGRITVG
ncbi:MAG: type VII secretion protein EssC [Candidatus Paralactobacillus gallistercoris]|uniref:Type VII secretion protein EssC n=1 Tax=Candidatus Paralactobacillus gallistercoris TaxID=2838724 RepID=A0A948X1H9_9LACO|nr:type VII secretion protein EssC [Candidatus Paralactobacillus gallistercoris]